MEEGDKWLVAVILAARLRSIRTPLDGIAVAAFVAIGFSFGETSSYMLHRGLVPELPRLLTGALQHMVFSSAWGYCLGVARRCHSIGLGVQQMAGGVALAAFLHGLANTFVEAQQWPGALAYIGDSDTINRMHAFGFIALLVAYWLLVRRARRLSTPRAAKRA
ncbi:MAG: PrsW family glutamic-type intramembrane protease [Candidatus Latescibacterota bacterium]|jgi:RsiW-degrading membrane proteinase PrsW (M82 family)